MKDGRTHLAHEAERSVDLDTGAVVAVTLQEADRGDTTLDERLSAAGMAVVELVGREAEQQPDDMPKVNVNGIEEVVADEGYHSGAVVQWAKSYEVRSYIPEPKPKGRHWQGKADEQQAVYGNRRRVRGEYAQGSAATARRVGGTRLRPLRHRRDAAYPSTRPQEHLEATTDPRRSIQSELLLLLIYLLDWFGKARNRPCRSQASKCRTKHVATRLNRIRRWPCQESVTYTTGC